MAGGRRGRCGQCGRRVPASVTRADRRVRRVPVPVADRRGRWPDHRRRHLARRLVGTVRRRVGSRRVVRGRPMAPRRRRVARSGVRSGERPRGGPHRRACGVVDGGLEEPGGERRRSRRSRGELLAQQDLRAGLRRRSRHRVGHQPGHRSGEVQGHDDGAQQCHERVSDQWPGAFRCHRGPSRAGGEYARILGQSAHFGHPIRRSRDRRDPPVRARLRPTSSSWAPRGAPASGSRCRRRPHRSRRPCRCLRARARRTSS